MADAPTTSQTAGSPKQFTIHIDQAMFKVPGPTMTGAELRALPTPAIGPDLDLWQDVPGGNDVKIAESDIVELKNGMHFFTAPAVIAPGELAC